MKISELSRHSGVPVATIKFYLREGLLPPGRATAARQAQYSADHLHRLRLIRALIQVGGLSIAKALEVLAAAETVTDRHELLGVTLWAIQPELDADVDDPEWIMCKEHVDSLVKRLDWQVSSQSPVRDVLVNALQHLHRIGTDYGPDDLLPYARLAEATALLDLDQLSEVENSMNLAERALVLTVLLEPVLLALRRLAQEHESALRFGKDHQGTPAHKAE
ncbi:MAG TPA: MerR family transcriptional regulator [Jatrophihabitantaceae bacterium]|nr:MerR family transcriptional regulator [Jatrophihabitantaceae bacterium]